MARPSSVLDAALELCLASRGRRLQRALRLLRLFGGAEAALAAAASRPWAARASAFPCAEPALRPRPAAEDSAAQLLWLRRERRRLRFDRFDNARRRGRHVERRHLGITRAWARMHPPAASSEAAAPQRSEYLMPFMPLAGGPGTSCPFPGVDCTSISPSCICTVRYTIERPIPLPLSFVV